jgi:hypothetical protein
VNSIAFRASLESGCRASTESYNNQHDSLGISCSFCFVATPTELLTHDTHAHRHHEHFFHSIITRRLPGAVLFSSLVLGSWRM